MGPRHGIMFLAAALGAALWVANAALDAFVNGEGRFLDLLLFAEPPHEVFIRSLGPLVILALGGVASWHRRRWRRAERALLANQEELRSLASALAGAEERQRRHIAAELHDRIGQMLVAAKIKAGLLRLAITSPDRAAEADEIVGLIDHASREVSSLTFELCPPVLYEVGLAAALEWLTNEFQQVNDIDCQFTEDGAIGAVSEETQGLLFQTARELLVNVAKHARATKAKLVLATDDRGLTIRVEDNGVGFDPAGIVRHHRQIGGFGLFSIRERLRHINGRLEIDAAPGRGSRVALVVPYRRAAETEEQKDRLTHTPG